MVDTPKGGNKMPANLAQPFSESCCDGGICSDNDMSASPCGCDPGEAHVCERHMRDFTPQELMKLDWDRAELMKARHALRRG